MDNILYDFNENVISLMKNFLVIRPDKNNEKKKVKKLYIIADEDHVHLQKGGISEPRMVIVYEGIAKFGKRVILQNKTHIGGDYDGRVEELWMEVLTFIENNYDTDYLEKIYLQGDGGAWIVSGKEYLIKTTYVLDEFHIVTIKWEVIING